MALTPQDVQQKEFAQQFRGYNEVEVDAFLDEVEQELTRLIAENEDLRARLANAAAAQAAAPPPSAEGEAILQRTLLLAQRTAEETVASARAEAERLLREARVQADRVLTASRDEARAALGDLDERRRQLEEQIEGLRAYEREYRSRLQAYLQAQLRDLEARAPVPPAPAAPTPVTPPVSVRAPAPAQTFAPVDPPAGPVIPRDTSVAAQPEVPSVTPANSG